MPTESSRLIVGILGSPRLGGNADLLLEAALSGAREEGAKVEKIILNTLDLRACQDCGGCAKTGVCVIKDDMQGIYALIEQMDAMVVASPIYFGGVTAQTKAMIDRCQAFWARKYLLNQPLAADNKQRRVLFLSSLGGHSSRQINATRAELESFIDTFDGVYEELIFPDIDAKGEVAEHWTALPQAHAAGAALAHGLALPGM
jgi:multimeric flavodoxin WrbA